MVFVKKLKIFHPFLFGKIGKKKVFGYILDRKKVVWLKKWLVDGFGQKNSQTY